jgi:hypothetical protein
MLWRIVWRKGGEAQQAGRQAGRQAVKIAICTLTLGATTTPHTHTQCTQHTHITHHTHRTQLPVLLVEKNLALSLNSWPIIVLL